MITNKTLRLLKYLQDHPGWHRGLSLAEAGLSSRGTIYVRLAKLEEAGFVERTTARQFDPPILITTYRALYTLRPQP